MSVHDHSHRYETWRDWLEESEERSDVTESQDGCGGERNPQDGDTQDSRDHQLQGGGEGLEDGVEFLEKQTGDNPQHGVVDDQDQHQRVDDGGERGGGEGTC